MGGVGKRRRAQGVAEKSGLQILDFSDNPGGRSEN